MTDNDEGEYVIKLENEAGSSQCTAALTLEKSDESKKTKRKVRFSLPTDADVFLIIPCILTLKSLDKDDKNLCKYFLPTLHQIDTKTFRLYF